MTRHATPVLLGFEQAFADSQPQDVRHELALAAELRQCFEELVAQLRPRGRRPDLTMRAAETLAGIMAKNYKTFRSVEVLATVGWESEAATLTRGLFEACVLVRFLTAKDCDRRVAMLWAHLQSDTAAQVERAIRYGVIVGDQAVAEARAFGKAAKSRTFDLPKGVNVAHHWSGLRGRLEAVCDGLGLGTWHAAVHGRLSSSAHGVDFHLHIAPQADRRPEIDFSPSRGEAAMVLSFARFFFADLVESAFEAFGDPVDLVRFKPPMFGDSGPASGRR